MDSGIVAAVEPERLPEIPAADVEDPAVSLLDAGIENYFVQELSSASEEYIPKWDF